MYMYVREEGDFSNGAPCKSPTRHCILVCISGDAKSLYRPTLALNQVPINYELALLYCLLVNVPIIPTILLCNAVQGLMNMSHKLLTPTCDRTHINEWVSNDWWKCACLRQGFVRSCKAAAQFSLCKKFIFVKTNIKQFFGFCISVGTKLHTTLQSKKVILLLLTPFLFIS